MLYTRYLYSNISSYLNGFGQLVRLPPLSFDRLKVLLKASCGVDVRTHKPIEVHLTEHSPTLVRFLVAKKPERGYVANMSVSKVVPVEIRTTKPNRQLLADRLVRCHRPRNQKLQACKQTKYIRSI